MYKIPTVGSYPSSIVFDTKGKLWFSEIFGKKIGMLDPVLAEDNTSKGITEYTIEDLDFEHSVLFLSAMIRKIYGSQLLNILKEEVS